MSKRLYKAINKVLEEEFSDSIQDAKDQLENVVSDIVRGLENAVDKIGERDPEIERLNIKLRDAESKIPKPYELEQIERGRLDLKKLQEVKRLAYNQGYADAYIEVQSKMKTGNIEQSPNH